MDYIEAIERESSALGAAAERAPDAEVASCPGWRMSDLVLHTGGVHRFWNEIVERRLQSYREASRPEKPPREEAVGWFREGAEHLVQTLTAADPEERVWTWAAAKNVAFVRRRMAQETAVHRWDAESAAGDPGPLAGALAADGVDELLDVFVPAQRQPFERPGESLHLHRTDGAGEWFVRFKPDGVSVQRSHAKGSVAVRAPASELLLLLWRRIGTQDVEVFGDGSLLSEFLAWMDLD